MTVLDPLHGDAYQFWSGIGGGSPLLLGFVVWLRRHNCHAHRCLRLGRHAVPGTPYVTCRKHHPTIPSRRVRPHQIAAEERLHRQRRSQQEAP